MARPNKDNILVNSLSPNELAELIAISVKKTKPNFTTEMAKLSMRAFIEIFADELKNARRLGAFKKYMVGRSSEVTFTDAFEKQEAIIRYLGGCDPTGEVFLPSYSICLSLVIRVNGHASV